MNCNEQMIHATPAAQGIWQSRRNLFAGPHRAGDKTDCTLLSTVICPDLAALVWRGLFTSEGAICNDLSRLVRLG